MGARSRQEGNVSSFISEKSNLWARLQSAGQAPAKGRFDMPIFITQGRFTREYVRGGLAKPEDRHAAVSKLCEQAGGKVPSLHFTLGHYDFLLLSDMPDAKPAAPISLVAPARAALHAPPPPPAF